MIDLSQNRKYIQSYIDLRNKYSDELLTKVITVQSTIAWFDGDGAGKIHCVVEDGKVVSAVIVHKRREVTVFSEKPRVGDELLREAEKMAFDLGFNVLWAKIEESNIKSIKLFERNSYEIIEVIDDKKIYEKRIHDINQYGFRNGAESFPKMVVLSFVYSCNSRCPSCPYMNSDIQLKYKDALFFPEDIFKKIADECGEYGSVIRLTGGGEPMLHKKVAELVKYATDAGCKVSVITNGSKDVSNIIDVADMIEFSVDAGCEEDYKKVRPGLSWETLNKNILSAIEKRKKTKIICSVINQSGIDVDLAKNYWKFLDLVQIRKFLTWGYNKDNSANPAPYLEEAAPCPWLWERLNIDSHGDITYCGEDIAFAYKFANIKDTTIAKVWTGYEYRKIREQHLNGKINEIELCKNCPDKKYRSWEFNYWKMREYANINTSA